LASLQYPPAVHVSAGVETHSTQTCFGPHRPRVLSLQSASTVQGHVVSLHAAGGGPAAPSAPDTASVVTHRFVV
jgi:hypothetical protein